VAISPVIANCVQIRLLYNIANSLAINVLNARAAAGVVVNQALADTLGSAIKTSWTTNLAPLTGTNSGLTRVGVRDLRVPNAAEFLDTGAGGIGTGVGDSLPASVCLCLTLRTAQAGKSFRGRMYISGFTEAHNVVLGVGDQAAATAAVGFANAIKANMTASQLTWAVASRPAEAYTVVKTTTHADGTTTAKTITRVTAKSGGLADITAVSSRDLNWESQRRRTNSRGAVPVLINEVAGVRFDAA
jgi:hypothetical protein